MILSQVRERLWVKVVGALSLVVATALGVTIAFNIHSQRKAMLTSSRESSRILTTAIEGGTFNALASGRNQEVVAQLQRLKDTVPSLDVTFFDFNRQVTFGTLPAVLGQPIDTLLENRRAIATVAAMLENGEEPQELFEEQLNGEVFLSAFRPVLNQQRCHHCHGSSRRVLGGMHVRTSNQGVQTIARTARNQSLLIALAGLSAVIAAIFLLFQRLVNRPLQDLLALAGKMRRGDLTQRLTIRGWDEVSHMGARMNLVNDEWRKTITEIACASQAMAAASAQQAASIEETSASMQELASNTQRNATDAGQADRLMTDSKGTVGRADQAMHRLVDAIRSISRGSEETTKIVKAIDEIAFQTNLLALNAAVEAARAGEAGAGFGVVADEVRSLALRAADAARHTTLQIEAISTQIAEGMTLVSETSQAFTELTAGIDQTSELVSRIAAASADQAQGIDQITTAIGEIEKATHQHAAVSEKLADASGAFKVDIPATRDPGGAGALIRG